MKLTLSTVKIDPKIADFVGQTEKYLDALGYTDHGPRHLNIVAERARALAKEFGLSSRDQELAAIAGYCHDMGSFLGRTQHHYWGAMLFGQVFLPSATALQEAHEVSTIMQAIVSHDKHELKIVNKITAILIIADKSDARRDRVKEKDLAKIKKDIHDRVNYSVIKNDLVFSRAKKEIVLRLKLDTKITDPLEYFEIFIERMAFCRQAAKFLGCRFSLIINDFKLSA